MALADMAAAQAEQPAGEPFQKPDVSAQIPEALRDPVDRIVAAGMKVMYSPQTRAQLQKAVQSNEPVPKVLAENVTGLILMLDSKTQGGLPAEPIFPAAVILLGDAAEVMTQAGKQVTMDQYNDGVRMLYVMLGKKMGGSDAQIMDAANKALPPEKQVAGGAPPDGPAAAEAPPQVPAGAAPQPGAMPPGAMPPDVESAEPVPDDEAAEAMPQGVAP